MIEAKNIVKTFFNGDKTQEVLKNISLKIGSGEFVSIIGRSGAGKSTLMYQLSLLDDPTSGTIILEDIDTSELGDAEKTNFRLSRLGYIFQDYALLPELTAIENVMLPLLMQGFSKEEASPKSRAALAKVGLEQRAGNTPSQLSGGEQQRVSIARAIAHEPIILFADEPTANLDSETAEKIISVLKDLHRGGQTIVMVTHELEYAEKTERIIRLDDGRIIEDKKVSRKS